jgi:hypothetical protein
MFKCNSVIGGGQHLNLKKTSHQIMLCYRVNVMKVMVLTSGISSASSSNKMSSATCSKSVVRVLQECHNSLT